MFQHCIRIKDKSHPLTHHSFQLQLQYTRELRAVAAARELSARDAVCSRLVEKVSVAGYSDVVYISELGCGINRGAMNFGRLYQVSIFSFSTANNII